MSGLSRKGWSYETVDRVGSLNLGDTPVALQLADRIPVSETDEVRVLGVSIEPEAKPDAKGVLRWDVTLKGRERREFRMEYTLDYPRDLAQRAALRTEGIPAAAAEMADESMVQQIDALELQLQ